MLEDMEDSSRWANIISIKATEDRRKTLKGEG